jgi:regulator of sirC expression with transglutaminase-like and TPR domain
MRQSRGVKGLDAVRDTFESMKRRSKTVRKARPPARAAASARRAGKSDSLDALVAAGAQALALPLDPAWHDGVKFNLQLVLRMAAHVDEFALPDSAEPAPVFHA